MASTSDGDFTIGVEEEFQIVHPETRALVPRAGRLLPRALKAAGDEVTNELFLSQIEVGTPVCRTLAEVRAEIVRLRRAVIGAAERDGCRIAASGTHPFSHWEDQRVTPKNRYLGIAEDYQQLAREQIICGCHVHVGIADREAAIRVMNRCRPWLATLLALASNSPFWLGVDTGYSSYRSELFLRFPTAGPPDLLDSRAEFDRVVSELIAIGLVDDASKIYWDIRPSMHFETLEFRVTDVCTSIDEAVMVAGLCRALAQECHSRAGAGEPDPSPRAELIRAARWQAARYGLEGKLVDVVAPTSASAPRLVELLLEFVRPSLEATGDWGEVSELVRMTLARGTGARRQREAFARTGRLEDVVDEIVTETARGTA
jgi:carboxylate-amine ligase